MYFGTAAPGMGQRVYWFLNIGFVGATVPSGPCIVTRLPLDRLGALSEAEGQTAQPWHPNSQIQC